MQIRVVLDGIEYSEPFGSTDIKIILERDRVFKGLLKKFTNKLTFIGDAYSYLHDLSINAGVTTQVECKIYTKRNYNSPWKLQIDGIINISDTREQMFPVNAIAATVEDNSWTSFINNNKSIEAVVSTPLTKNAFVLDSPAMIPIDMFTSTTGVHDQLDRTWLKVDDVFRALISFMTDNKVGYESPLFGSGGEREHTYITSGVNLHQANVNSCPKLSFINVYRNIDKKFNIGFRIDDTGTQPILVIDKTDNIFTEGVSATFENPYGAEKYFNKDILHAIIKVGEKKIMNYDNDVSNYINYLFIGWGEETYHVLGQSNIDSTLDLVSDWIADHNIINQVLVNGTTDYDDDIFILTAYNDAGTIKAKRFTQLAYLDHPWMYNMDMNNDQVVQNHLGAVPNSLSSYLASPETDFLAETNVEIPVVNGVIIYPTEITDVGANYDPLTGRFTADVERVLDFNTVFQVRATTDAILHPTLTFGTLLATFYFRRYNSADEFIEERWITNVYNSALFGFLHSMNVAFYLEIGDYVVIEADVIYEGLVIRTEYYSNNSHFESGANNITGGQFNDIDPDDFRALLYSFNTDFEYSQMESILDDETDLINFVLDNKTYSGWVQRIEFNLTESIVDVQLTNKNRI